MAGGDDPALRGTSKIGLYCVARAWRTFLSLTAIHSMQTLFFSRRQRNTARSIEEQDRPRRDRGNRPQSYTATERFAERSPLLLSVFLQYQRRGVPHAGSRITFESVCAQFVPVRRLESFSSRDLAVCDNSMRRSWLGTIQFYLFFGEGTSAANVLHLYHATSIDGLFRKHPCSPVVIDPACARMGGRIVCCGDGLIRFGQDNCYGYGARLNAFRIVVLDENRYEEVFIGCVEMDDAHGPHTIDLYQGMCGRRLL